MLGLALPSLLSLDPLTQWRSAWRVTQSAAGCGDAVAVALEQRQCAHSAAAGWPSFLFTRSCNVSRVIPEQQIYELQPTPG